ncbi:MAG: dephospho-CoA kinase, partial [Corynebacterium urealyticum]
RGELARRAFATTEDTMRLNSITHPAIRAESERRFAAAEEAGEQAVIYDMPLLVDLGLYQDMDLTVVVDVDKEERIRRLVAKRGLDEADARARMAQQIDDEARLATADVVIDNNGPLDALDQQVAALVEKIKG